MEGPINMYRAGKQEDETVLPEISRLHEMKIDREREPVEYIESAKLWYWNMVEGKPFNVDKKAEIIFSQQSELPYMVSSVMERVCTLQCAHCLYQKEKSSAAASRESHLAEVIEHMVSSLPQASEDGPDVKFMSAGRILRPWHLDLLKNLRRVRPDVKLGVIDNGTYTKLLSKWPEGLKLDWLDVSIDGTEEHHNEQRGSANAYADAMNGLRHAREIVRPRAEGGYIASLLTLTSINARDVLKVADAVLDGEDGEPLVDKLNIVTMSPTNAINAGLEMHVDDFAEGWSEIKRACEKYNTPGNERISLGLYRIEDVEKLAAVVGEQKFLESFPSDEAEAEKRVRTRGNFIETHIDGVPVSYLPVSIWPPEELLIEADAAYRLAFEGQFTLDELRTGRSKNGRDTKPYTVAQLTPETDFHEVYEKAVELYWQRFGHKKLDEEFAAFQRIRSKAGK